MLKTDVVRRIVCTLLAAGALILTGSGTADGHAEIGQSAGASRSTPDSQSYSAYQVDAARDGHSLAVLSTHLGRIWRYPLRAISDTPLVVGDRVFLSIGSPSTNDSATSDLVALSARTGHRLWGPEPLQQSTAASTLAYSSGQLFTNTDGIVQAWNATDGRLNWTADLNPDGFGSRGGIAAADGTVVVTGTGSQLGGLTALAATTGAVVWTNDNAGYLGAEPELGIGDGVVVVPSSCSAAAYGLRTGVALWSVNGHIETGCPDTRTSLAPIHNGAVHISGQPSGLLVNAQTGKVDATDVSGAPAWDGNAEFWVDNGRLHAHRLTSAPHHWTAQANDYVGPPVTVSGMVLVATTTGTVDAVKEATGALLWSKADTATTDLSGQTIQPIIPADNALFLQQDDSLVAYANQKGLPSAPVRPKAPPTPSIPLQPTPTSGTSWSGLGGNPANSDDNAAENVRGPYSVAWSADIGAPGSQSVIVPGGVFVLTVDTRYEGAALHGFSTTTGQPLWPAVGLGGSYPGADLTESDGVLVISDPDSGNAMGVSTSTGQVVWAHQPYDGQTAYVAAGGLLFNANTVSNLFTGRVIGNLDIGYGDAAGFDAFGGGSLYIQGACNHMYKFTGSTEVWSYPTDCDGGFFGIAMLAQGTVLGGADEIVDHSTATGAITDTTASSTLPASAGNTFFVTDGRRVVAEHAHTHRINWSYTMPGNIAGSPVVTGHTVLVLDADSNLTALDALTGSVEWSGKVPARSSSSFQGFWISAAQGVVVIPTTTGITVLKATGGVTDPGLPTGPPPGSTVQARPR